MRELHVVALSEDGRHVVLATRAGTAAGEFRVALDERLTAAVRGELPAPGREAPPSISPREIQSRLRDGQAPEDIAAAAGVPVSRVERYAGPVLAELDRMITGARAAVVTRPRLGASALPLGEAVEVHLAEVAHLAEGSVRWSARRADPGRWVVEVSWTARGRRRTAGWHYDPATREVRAVDGPSAVLGHVEDETPSGSGRPAAAAPADRAAGRTGPRSSAATGRSVERAPAAPRRGATAPAAQRRDAAPTAGTAARGATASGRQAAPAADAARRRTAAPAPTTPAARPRRDPAPAATTAATTATTTGVASSGQAATARTPAATAAAARAGTARAASARTPTARTPTARTPTVRTPTAPTSTTARSTATSTTARTPAAATPATGTSARPAAARPAPARSAPAEPAPASVRQRRAAARRGAVPPVAASPTAPPVAPSAAVPAGPPVLRVVPPAEPDPAQSDDRTGSRADGQAEARPARRAAGGRDWADVLMGGAPVPPAAEPRQD